MFKNTEVNQEMLDYISEFGHQQNPIQKEIIQYNKTLGNQERLQLSVTQSNILQMLIKLCKIEDCLEIGTFTGYSALSMALALPESGRVTTLDNDEKNISVANFFFEKAKLDDKVMTIFGPALDSLKKFAHDKKFFDLIFIDADKKNYIKYFNISLDLIKKKGIIIVDNVLWHGDVYNKTINDKETNIIRDFNLHIKNDKRIEKFIIPLGDGLTICRKL
jgi:predicted O-methyltransferase YrrM